MARLFKSEHRTGRWLKPRTSVTRWSWGILSRQSGPAAPSRTEAAYPRLALGAENREQGNITNVRSLEYSFSRQPVLNPGVACLTVSKVGERTERERQYFLRLSRESDRNLSTQWALFRPGNTVFFSWIGVIETHGQCTTLPRSGGRMHSVDEISAERG